MVVLKSVAIDCFGDPVYDSIIFFLVNLIIYNFSYHLLRQRAMSVISISKTIAHLALTNDLGKSVCSNERLTPR
jgi:hypothetical protein